MQLEYRQSLAPVTPALTGLLIAASSRIFARAEPQSLQWRLQRMPEASVFFASHEDRVIGFKIGYALSDRKYYSWLGGVDPDFRRLGIAGQLMSHQHAWLCAAGFAVVETRTHQDNHAMVQVNLRAGFSVCGMLVDDKRTQIVFCKSLSQAPHG